ncbi:hypothetical protein [Streptomyces sp. NPDC020965]|uniref:hypothetical protein n=1 Tax=Streptomyces sp. NPDC020965 TaxID=3365105 RepID=UPI00379544CE
MIWWFRVRAAPAVLASLLVVLATATLVRTSEVPVPSVVGGLTSGLPLRFLAPLLPVLLLLYGQARADRAMERVAARGVRWFDPSFAIGMVAIAGAVSVVVPDGVAVTRNIAGYLGFALLARWLSTYRLAMALVSFLPFAVTSSGGHANPALWGWPLHDGSSAPALAVATALFLLGLATYLRPPLRNDTEETDA